MYNLILDDGNNMLPAFCLSSLWDPKQQFSAWILLVKLDKGK